MTLVITLHQCFATQIPLKYLSCETLHKKKSPLEENQLGKH